MFLQHVIIYRVGYMLHFKYAVVILLGLIIILGAFFKQDWLVVKNVQGQVVLLAPILSNKEFFVRFTHSVALTPVDEFFVVNEEDIVLKRTVYHDFGAGLPHMAEAGQSMVFEDGKIIISGFNLIIPTLHVRVGRIAKHRLYVPNLFTNKFTRFSLDSFVKPGQALALNIKQMSFLQAFCLGGMATVELNC